MFDASKESFIHINSAEILQMPFTRESCKGEYFNLASHILHHIMVTQPTISHTYQFNIGAASVVHTTSTSPSHPYIQYTPPALAHHIHTFSTHTSTSPSHPYIQYTPPALAHHIHTFSTHTSTSPSHPYIQYTPPALAHHIHTFSTHHQH